MKKRFVTFLGGLGILCFLNVERAQAQEEFEGIRRTECVIAQSDLNNFVTGGKSTLDMIMAQNQEEWYTFYSELEGSTLKLYLEYSFDTYEDYEEKTAELLGYVPITTYGEDAVSYVENFAPLELFNFVDGEMEEAEVVEETSFRRLLSLYKDTVELNGMNYEVTRPLNVADDSEIKFEAIDIYTSLEEGVYERKIELRIDEEASEQGDKVLQRRCGDLDVEVVRTNDRNCTVVFASSSEKELVQKTMLVLGTSVNIEHSKHYLTEDEIRKGTTESIGVDAVLNKDGNFTYTMQMPESYENLSPYIKVQSENDANEAESSTVTVSENKVSYKEREGKVQYYYDAPLKFEDISIVTDISNEFEKTKRIITFRMDEDIAGDYYESVKKKIKAKLDRGDVLRIYDEDGFRCYEISYSSWFTKDINRFTNRILGVDNSQIEIQRSIIPFKKSTIQDRFNLEEGDVSVYSETVDLEYIVPKNAKVTDEVQEGEECKQIIFSSSLNFSASREFSCFFYKKYILYILVILAIGGIIFGLVKYLKNRITELVQKKKTQREEKKKMRQVKFCPKCGNQRTAGSGFCGKCGYKY